MRISLIAALFSLPIVAAASAPTLAANYGSSATGGGSAGYNHGVATDYRLTKHHRVKRLHASAKPQAAAPQAPKATPGQAGGGAAKQPMGRP
jgi:hypothetical protein